MNASLMSSDSKYEVYVMVDLKKCWLETSHSFLNKAVFSLNIKLSIKIETISCYGRRQEARIWHYWWGNNLTNMGWVTFACGEEPFKILDSLSLGVLKMKLWEFLMEIVLDARWGWSSLHEWFRKEIQVFTTFRVQLRDK